MFVFFTRSYHTDAIFIIINTWGFNEDTRILKWQRRLLLKLPV
jgi:hypothetical protein